MVGFVFNLCKVQHKVFVFLSLESDGSVPKEQFECCCSQNVSLNFGKRDKVIGNKAKKNKRKPTSSFTSLPSSYLCSQPALHHPDVEMGSCCLIHFHTTVGNHKHCFTWEFHIRCPQRTKFYQLGLLEEK